MYEDETAGLPAGAGASASDASLAIEAQRLDRPSGPSLEFLIRRPERASGRPPVLLVHGAFTGAWCWEESWLHAIGRTGRLAAAVSLRGHGGSAMRDTLGSTSLQEFADDVLLAIKAMPEPPVLVAHSIGGLLAQHLLAAVPTGHVDLRGLVLVGSLPPEGLALIGPWLGLSFWCEALAGGLGRMPKFGRNDAMFGAGIDPAEAATYAARMGTDAFLQLCLGSFASLAQAYIPAPVLPAWLAGQPTLVLHGADDRLVDTVSAWRTALYHGADFETVPDAGHCPMLGPHADIGARAMIRWLDRRGL